MSIMSIRRLIKKMLAPVVLVLVLGLLIGIFYIGVPNIGRDTYAYNAYKGPSIKIYGQIVKDADFNNYLMRAFQQATQYIQIKSFSEAEIREAAVGAALQTVAFEREMKKAGSKINVSNAEIDKVIKKYWPTEEELKNIMERQGFASKRELRKALAKELKYQKFVRYKARQLKIKVPKEEVLGLLEKIKVSHILVATKDLGKTVRSDAEALKRANEVYQKLINGEDFGKLAKEYSDDPRTKDKAGVIGPMPLDTFKTQMVKEFVDVSLALAPGKLSKPVKSQYGYHVIRLESREMPTGKEYKEEYKEIEDMLLFQKAEYDPKYSQWLQDIYKKAEENMEILDPGLRAYRLMKQEKWQEALEAFQKALKKSYYKNKPAVYVDAAEVYLKLNQPKKAIEMLTKKVPAEVRDDIEFQIALAKAYREDKQPKIAEEMLLQFGEEHRNDSSIHQRLKAVFTEWQMTDAVAKEEQILAEIERKEKEELKKYQQELDERHQTEQTK